jgi:hypothetical protein
MLQYEVRNLKSMIAMLIIFGMMLIREVLLTTAYLIDIIN